MKNLLLLLILANVLYLMWGMFVVEDTQPGVAIVKESDLARPLEVTAGRDSEAMASVGAVLGSGDPSDLEAVVGRSCVTIRNFTARRDADTAVLEFTNQGMQAAVRSVPAQIFVGHWVQIRDVPDDAAANTMLEKLAAGGLSDAYLVRTEDEGLKISLGLFGDAERAERVELQARSMGLAADISPRMRDGTALFVDVGLPPGRGAGDIVERYGEERVALRDEAACP
jgi:hypothetical protein